MNANCFWYENPDSKPDKPGTDIIWKILPWIIIVTGIVLNIRFIHEQLLIMRLIPFLVVVVGFYLIIIQRVLHPSRPKRFLVVLDDLGMPYIVDITSLSFLQAFGLEKYKMVYRGGSSGRQLSGEIENNKRYNHIIDHIQKENVIDLLCQNPGLGGEKIERITSIWKGSYYFTVSYQVTGDKKARRARFYNDITAYERLYEKFDVMYKSTDHKEAKNKVLMGSAFMAVAIILLPVTMIASTHSPSIALNLTMLIAVMFLFAIGLTILSKR